MVKFKTPDNFGALLSSQDYGPTTQLISDDVRYASFYVISYLIVYVHRSSLRKRGILKFKCRLK